jgi:hypothetical protein
MAQATKIPRREWLAVVLPLLFPLIVLASVAGAARSRPHGVLVLGCCVAAGSAVSLVCTVVLLREGRLFLSSGREIAESKRRIARNQSFGWVLGVTLVAGTAILGGFPRAVLLSAFAGLTLGLWPGLLANFIRLRREGHWTKPHRRPAKPKSRQHA